MPAGAGMPGTHPRPRAAEVLRRALALSCVAARAGLENCPDPDEAAATHRRMGAWLADTGLGAVLEPSEAALVATPLGALAEADAAGRILRRAAPVRSRGTAGLTADAGTARAMCKRCG